MSHSYPSIYFLPVQALRFSIPAGRPDFKKPLAPGLKYTFPQMWPVFCILSGEKELPGSHGDRTAMPADQPGQGRPGEEAACSI